MKEPRSNARKRHLGSPMSKHQTSEENAKKGYSTHIRSALCPCAFPSILSTQSLISLVMVWIMSVTFSGADPPFSQLNLMPKSSSRFKRLAHGHHSEFTASDRHRKLRASSIPPGLWEADKMKPDTKSLDRPRADTIEGWDNSRTIHSRRHRSAACTGDGDKLQCIQSLLVRGTAEGNEATLAAADDSARRRSAHEAILTSAHGHCVHQTPDAWNGRRSKA